MAHGAGHDRVDRLPRRPLGAAAARRGPAAARARHRGAGRRARGGGDGALARGRRARARRGGVAVGGQLDVDGAAPVSARQPAISTLLIGRIVAPAGYAYDTYLVYTS